MARNKNIDWNTSDGIAGGSTMTGASLAVLMDLRDEAQTQTALLRDLVRLAGCYRIPRALDAMYELGVAERRRKRNAAKRRKAARA